MSEEKTPATLSNGGIVIRQSGLKQGWRNGFPLAPDHTIFIFQRDTNEQPVMDENGHPQVVFRGTPPVEAQKPKI